MTRVEALRILGLEPDATPDEVKSAYRELVKTVHPDKNSAPNARHLFQLVQEAYEFISADERQEQTRENEASERAQRERRPGKAEEKAANEGNAEREWERQRAEAEVGFGWWFIPVGVCLYHALRLGVSDFLDFIHFDLPFQGLPLVGVTLVVLTYKANAWLKKCRVRRFYRKRPPPTGVARDKHHSTSAIVPGEEFSFFLTIALFSAFVFLLLTVFLPQIDVVDWSIPPVRKTARLIIAFITVIAVLFSVFISTYHVSDWSKKLWRKFKGA